MATDAAPTRRWVYRECTDASLEQRLARGLSIEPIVARVLAARGFDDAGAALAWLSPSMKSGLHDPSLLPDLDRAAQRLLEAARKGEPIVVYGDYDVDGITASAIVWHVLGLVVPGAPVSCFVPHRLDDGYGLHSECLEELASHGAKVVVSVDCGVTAFEPARRAKQLGLDLIITDHHNLPPEEDGLPDAYAVVHPRRAGSAYPWGELCGAGVAFKLAWRIATMAAGGGRVDEDARECLLDLLAFAALGTVADIVPLEDENRVIARFGLARMKSTRIEGLRALIAASGLDGESVTSEDAGFKLGPRLNACGRLGHAREAVELLTEARGQRAVDIATELTAMNTRRRSIETTIFEQASAMVEAKGLDGPGARAIVLADEGWHPGVLGIVCSRLVRRYHRPTILLERKNGSCQGSGRSIDGYSLHAGLAASAAHLDRWGGHDMAAGLALRTDAFESFVELFSAHASGEIKDWMLSPRITIDATARVGEIGAGSATQLARMGPFGRSNPSPRILLKGARLMRPPQTMGAGGKHLSMQVFDDAGAGIRVVGWGWGDRLGTFSSGGSYDCVVEIGINRWGGRESAEATLIDACEATA